MKKYAITFLLLVFGLAPFAQEKTDTTAAQEPWTFNSAEKYWKLSPFDVISVLPTLGTDLEVRMKDNISLQAGVAVLPSFLQFSAGDGFNEYDNLFGYRLRTEGRIYMPRKTNRYLGLGVSFRHMVIRTEIPFGFEGTVDEFGQETFAYFKDTEMRFNRFNTNFDFKLGFQRVTEHKLVFDFYMGFSIRDVKVKTNSEIPNGAGTPELRGFWRLEDNYSITYPTPIIGFKMGFGR